jgi:hypothetical protein
MMQQARTAAAPLIHATLSEFSTSSLLGLEFISHPVNRATTQDDRSGINDSFGRQHLTAKLCIQHVALFGQDETVLT